MTEIQENSTNSEEETESSKEEAAAFNLEKKNDETDGTNKVKSDENGLESAAEDNKKPLQNVVQNTTTITTTDSTRIENSNISSGRNNLPLNSNNMNNTISNSANQNIVSAEQQLAKAKRDLESMVLKYARSERENLSNKSKIDDLDKKLKRTIKDNDQLANRIKILTNDKNQLTDTLNAKVAQLTVLEQKNSYLTNVQGEKLKQCEEKLKSYEILNEELKTQIEGYKSKEGELLDFSERLSMKHMLLQNELDEALKKIPNYKDFYEATLKEKEELLLEIDKYHERIDKLNLDLENERSNSEKLRANIEENEMKYRNSLDELQNEIKVLQRRYRLTTREMIKEIKSLKPHGQEHNSTASILDKKLE